MSVAGRAALANPLQSLPKIHLIIPVSVVGILLVMVLPMPSMAMDLLISLNITLSIIILLVSMYILQPVSSEGVDTEIPLVAADPKGLAAPGDMVVYVTSTDATQSFDSGYAPVNASIVELVDEIS